MQKFYFNNIPAIVNIDDGEDEQTTINTIIDILEDAGYEFEEDVKEVEELKELNKLEKAKQIIKKNYRDAECGIFHTRNIMGDPMENIYDDDELQIDICRYYEYFEVFGLEKEEFKELAKYYYSLGNGEVEE